MHASSDVAHGVVKNTVNESSLSTAKPDWCALLRCEIHQGVDTIRSIFASAPHPDSASCLSSLIRDFCFFAQYFDMMTKRKRSV